MKIETKNCVGVAILLCLGFVMGRTTILPDANADSQKSQVGRYLITIGEIEVSSWVLTEDMGPLTNPYKTLLRIDTQTGDVDLYLHELILPTAKDTLERLESHIQSVPVWKSLTSVEVTPLTYKEYLEGMKKRLERN